LIKNFTVKVEVKNDQLTRDAGDDIAEILLEVIASSMHNTLLLPWVLGAEVTYAPSD
jgi:hypothetical protein